MKPFDYYKVTTVKQAVDLLARYQEKAAILAGGSDLLGMMKDRIEGPKLKPPAVKRQEMLPGIENKHSSV